MLDQSACVSTADVVGEGATVCRMFDLEDHGTDWWKMPIDPLFATTVHDIVGPCPDLPRQPGAPPCLPQRAR